MTDRPLRLGPDPNRTHLERWNEMHPDRYGRPDTPAETENGRHRWLSLDDVDNGPDNAPSSHGFLESLLGLAILILAPIIGLFVTLPLYQWTRPDNLTPAWTLSYAGVFVVATFAGAVLVYALRRVLLILALAALTFGIGYAAWHLWLAQTDLSHGQTTTANQVSPTIRFCMMARALPDRRPNTSDVIASMSNRNPSSTAIAFIGAPPLIACTYGFATSPTGWNQYHACNADTAATQNRAQVGQSLRGFRGGKRRRID